jgi:hypothetical protein
VTEVREKYEPQAKLRIFGVEVPISRRLGWIIIAAVVAVVGIGGAYRGEVLERLSVYEDTKVTLNILEATFGTLQQPENNCDATAKIGRYCDGKESCQFSADTTLCGDPAPNITKTLRVIFECGYDVRQEKFGESKAIRTLRC